MASAEDLGARLLGEVEVVGLDEVLYALRHFQPLVDETERTKETAATTSPTPRPYFNIPPLDRLLHAIPVTPIRTSNSPPTSPQPPILELTSQSPGSGKTHLLYLLIAQAVLPSSSGGSQSTAILLDTDNHFSVSRLAAQLRLQIRLHALKTSATSSTKEAAQQLEDGDIEQVVSSALRHVHVFRPQNLMSTVATLSSLPEYLFDKARHSSFDRAVGLLALDSASAFYWLEKAEEEDAAFLAATSSISQPKGQKPPGARTVSEYAALATSLNSAGKVFSCPVVITTWHLGPTPSTAQFHPGSSSSSTRSLRPSLPAPMAALPTLRLVVQRKAVRKFPPGIRVEEALREAVDRLKAVEEGRFEALVCEWGVEERMLVELKRRGGGIRFGVGREGIVIEED